MREKIRHSKGYEKAERIVQPQESSRTARGNFLEWQTFESRAEQGGSRAASSRGSAVVGTDGILAQASFNGSGFCSDQRGFRS